MRPEYGPARGASSAGQAFLPTCVPTTDIPPRGSREALKSREADVRVSAAAPHPLRGSLCLRAARGA